MCDRRLHPYGRVIKTRSEFEERDRVAADGVAEAALIPGMGEHAVTVELRQQVLNVMLFEFG